MTTAFEKKNLKKSIILAVILVVTCFSIDSSSVATAQIIEVPVIFNVSPVGSGSITVFEMETTYTSETTLNLTTAYLHELECTPNSGYRFSHWSSTGSITFANPYSFSTTANISGPGTITAVFTLQYPPVTFNISPPGAGSINIYRGDYINETLTSQTTFNLTAGASYQLTAKPNSGYISPSGVPPTQ